MQKIQSSAKESLLCHEGLETEAEKKAKKIVK
jgi:hypothetical protein